MIGTQSARQLHIPQNAHDREEIFAHVNLVDLAAQILDNRQDLRSRMPEPFAGSAEAQLKTIVGLSTTAS